MQPHQWPASSLMRAAEGYSCRPDTKVSQQQACHVSGTEMPQKSSEARLTCEVAHVMLADIAAICWLTSMTRSAERGPIHGSRSPAR